MKSVLFPFEFEADLDTGYAWSLELAARLKGQLSLFTVTPDGTLEQYARLYGNLIKARQFHLQQPGALPQGRKVQPVLRNFFKGNFETTFLHFIENSKFDLLVLPPKIVSSRILATLINSGKHIISIPSLEAKDISMPASSRGTFFLELLHQAACYNLPSSFYKTVSEDKTLFNSIAAFFKRPDLNSENLSLFK